MRGISPSYYRDRLVRFWWLALLCALFGGIGGWLGGGLLFAVYSSTALVQVDLRSTPSSASVGVIVDRVTHTGAQLALSDGLLRPIASREGLSVASVRSELTVSPLANTELLSITVRDREASRSARLANAVASAVVTTYMRGLATINAQSQAPFQTALTSQADAIVKLQAQLAQLGQPPSDPALATQLSAQLEGAQAEFAETQGTLSRIQSIEASQSTVMRVASPAPVSGTPVLSHQIVTGLAGALIGIALALVLIIGRDWLNSRVASAEAVESNFSWRRLGRPPTQGSAPASATSMAEVAKSLARDLRFLQVEGPLRTLALVSPTPSSRASALAAELANSIAMEGGNALLVDARLRDGALHERFGLAAEPGLSDLTLSAKSAQLQTSNIMRAVRVPERSADARLRFIAAGTRPPNPERILGSEMCLRAIGAIERLPADVVVFDTPSALFRHEQGALASLIDGVIVIVDPQTARRRDLAELSDALDASDQAPIGYVFLGGLEGDRASNSHFPRSAIADDGSGRRQGAPVYAVAPDSGGLRSEAFEMPAHGTRSRHDYREGGSA